MTSKVLRVGITGGIGAGKSTVCELFSILGISIYDADSEAKRMMNHNPLVKEKLSDLFGKAVYSNGELNRRLIAQQVFDNQTLLNNLNAIVHPAVHDDFNRWVLRQSSPYVLKEAALLFETGSYRELDSIITVIAPRDIKVNRILKRDPERSRTEIDNIMSKQWGDKQREKWSDYTIVNDEKVMIIPQALAIHETIMKGLPN